MEQPITANVPEISPRLREEIPRWLLVLGLLVIVTTASIALPNSFGTWSNYKTILASQAIALVVALGVLSPLTVGDFDLSIGGVFSLAGIVLAVLNAQHGFPVLVAIAVVLVLGLIVGLVNAALSVGLRVNSFVVTLGSGTVLSGIALWLSHSNTISGVSPGLVNWLGGTVVGLPILFVIALVLVLILLYAFDHTPFGRHMLFVGSNPLVGRLSGLRVGMIRATAFAVSATVAAIGGVLLTGQLGAADPQIGSAYLLPAYSAAFLSTTAVRLGRFNPLGTMIAVYFLATGITAIELLGVESWVEQVFYGAALMGAVSLASLAARSRTKA
jgi:ribose transport system permease protein